jgi:proline iminopeptidase
MGTDPVGRRAGWLAAFTLAALGTPFARAQTVVEPTHGESVLARAEHVVPELVTAVPPAPRWCDRVPGLDKRRIDVGGASLYVELEGHGTPLVLINGGPGGTHHYFHPWFSRLKDQATVVYYDQRGCGLSDFAPGKDGYSVEQAVEDLEAVRRSLGFDTWTVLGFSYGGFLAQLYAILHPEHVSGLVLLGASTGLAADSGPSREGSYLSAAERRRVQAVGSEVEVYATAHGLSPADRTGLLIYNILLNGDWKRQNFFRPSPERVAQMARYEWVHDGNFNGILNATTGRWDFAGAFEGSPIQTLILEGQYDLTWGQRKAQVLAANHPGARLLTIDNASHGIYDEAPEAFFPVVRGFLAELRPAAPAALAAYRTYRDGWLARMKARPDLIIDALDWGRGASRALAAKYAPAWLDAVGSVTSCLRTGFALYDERRYADALAAFERMESRAGAADPQATALALIWQGHMLDLLGRRADAIARYRRVAAMELDGQVSHGHYGLKYRLSPYARERMTTPFTRVENRAEH